MNTQRLIESLTDLMNKIKLWFWPLEEFPIGYCDTTPDFPNLLILDIRSESDSPRATVMEVN